LSEWKHQNSPRPKKAQKSKSKIKVMLNVFFNYLGIMCHEFVPEGQTVNAAFYVEILKRLRGCVHRVQPNLRGDSRWILNKDNAPSHTALIAHEFFGAQFNHCDGPPTLLTGFSSMRFFLVSKVQLCAAWVLSVGRGNSYCRINNVAQRLEGRRLSRVLQPMETEVGQVHCI
jgi:hypothetical protein